MNALRRKKLNEAKNQLEKAKEIVAAALEDEQEYFENMPENLQNSERGENSQSAISYLEEAEELFDDIQENIDNAIEC